MSNEIIIDGCNVAECIESLTIEGYAVNCRLTNSCCKDSPNCYFKQLKRLKDKSEKISYRFKQTKKANKQYKTDIKNLQAELEQYKKSAVRELKATDKIEFKQYYKAENERLQAENEKLKAELNNIKIIADSIQADTGEYDINDLCTKIDETLST